MALDFPANPVNGQVYDNFYYDSSMGTWRAQGSGLAVNAFVNPTITGGTISGLTTDLAIADGGTGASDAATARINIGAAATTHSHLGLIKQATVATKTDQYTTTAAGWVAVPGLSVTITPSSLSSKIIIFASINMSLSGAGGDAFVRLVTNSGAIGNGSGGYFGQVAGQDYFAVDTKSISYIHSPNTTSSHSYWIEVSRGANTLYVNGRGYDGSFVTSSQILVQELAQE